MSYTGFDSTIYNQPPVVSLADTMEKRIVFPFMLHRLLDESEANDTSHIVSWLPGGKAFKVHRRDAFASDVLPKYYRQTRYKSFVRQLNLWGFTCISHGMDRGSYMHASFVRGEITRCHAMRRIKIKGNDVATDHPTCDYRPVDVQNSGEVVPFVRPSSPNEQESVKPSTVDLNPVDYAVVASTPADDVSGIPHVAGDFPPIDFGWLYKTPKSTFHGDANAQDVEAADQQNDFEHEVYDSDEMLMKIDEALLLPTSDYIAQEDALFSNVDDGFHFPLNIFDDDNLEFELLRS